MPFHALALDLGQTASSNPEQHVLRQEVDITVSIAAASPSPRGFSSHDVARAQAGKTHVAWRSSMRAAPSRLYWQWSLRPDPEDPGRPTVRTAKASEGRRKGPRQWGWHGSVFRMLTLPFDVNAAKAEACPKEGCWRKCCQRPPVSKPIGVPST